MPTSRPFSYNPSQQLLPGTINIGTMCVGVSSNPYIDNYRGLTWWNGPDEELGYCIGTVVPAQNQSTPLGNIGNVKFWRTPTLTDEAFLTLVKEATGQTFTDTPTACAYLDSNNYWTSYTNLSIYYFAVSNRCSTKHYRENGDRTKSYIIADTTPAYKLYQKTNRNRSKSTWTELAINDVGSPPKISGGGDASSPHQYGYLRGYWITDVVVYKKGGITAYGFPDGNTFTYGTSFYQTIVAPWVP